MTRPDPATLRPLERRFSVAPMMGCTDRHARYLMRLLSRRALLYTEMIAVPALEHGDRGRLLAFNAEEHPIAVQIGGHDPEPLGRAAALAEAAGYDEINLNVGCPSARVQAGSFGARLMAEPDRVARIVEAMRRRTSVPITVKTRLGIDRNDSFDHLARFVARLRDAGCDALVLHARKAWLDGVNPRENRELPPLRYDVASAVARAFPDLPVVLNGGLRTLAQCQDQCADFAGFMIGRESYANPWMLAEVDPRLFGATAPSHSREAVLEAYTDYVDRECARGIPLGMLVRPLLGLFRGQPGARRWRRTLMEAARHLGAGAEILTCPMDVAPALPDSAAA